jgi:hypothetical protein
MTVRTRFAPARSIQSGDIGGVVPFAQMARVLEIVRSLQGGLADQPPEPEANS